MRFSSRLFTVLAVLGLASCPLSARADIIVGNLGQPPDPTLSPSIIDPSDFWAQQFTSGIATSMVSIEASLGDFNAGTSNFALTAQLVSVTSESMTPDLGTVVATLTQVGSIPTTGFANITFDASAPIALNPSLYYWFVLTASSTDMTGNVGWQFTDSSTVSGTGTLPNYAGYAGELPSPSWESFPGTPFLIQVNGLSAVPEPTSLILGCVGFSAVIFGAARSRRRPASK
jgi:hypothetical protein